MKKKYLLVLLTLGIFAHGAKAQQSNDTNQRASSIVASYYSILNYDAIPKDSILYIETHIVQRGSTDTLLMLRWFAVPQYNRIEIWDQNVLLTGYHSDGKSSFREYDTTLHMWKDINSDTYLDKVAPYDFHGPLYHWQNHGVELQYDGEYKFEGHPVYRISAKSPQTYDRKYLFEKETGLLFLFTESDSIDGNALARKGNRRKDWHAYHEFQPLNTIVLPSQESYQYNSTITLISHKAKFIGFNQKLF